MTHLSSFFPTPPPFNEDNYKKDMMEQRNSPGVPIPPHTYCFILGAEMRGRRRTEEVSVVYVHSPAPYLASSLRSSLLVRIG